MMKILYLNILNVCFFLFALGCTSNKTVVSDREIVEGDASKKELVQLMEKVLDWQIANFSYKESGNLHDYGIDAWTNGVLYLGASEFAAIADKSSTYYDWLYTDIGEKNNWQIPANFKNYAKYSLYHADELCIGQFYINMYKKYGDSKMLCSTIERINWIMDNPVDTTMSHRSKQAWTWCDALFMAPPVYVNIAEVVRDNNKKVFLDENMCADTIVIKPSENYLNYMHTEFGKTYDHLYDKSERLFFRDDSYFSRREANGEKVFWGRGNGWVVAGIANLLKSLPENDSRKSFYVELYQTMLKRLVELRGKDGFWHASLLDPGSYPSPETSATAMIVYAMAYGVNNGYLDKSEYLPVIESSWEALTSVIDENGKLGYVQPIGADPKKVTQDMTAVYGVGALLLAGTEIYKLN